jgi:hypothetical protein
MRQFGKLFFLEYLENAFDADKLTFFDALKPLRDRRAVLRRRGPARKTEWVVYAKPPFGGPEQVLADVARLSRTGMTSLS